MFKNRTIITAIFLNITDKKNTYFKDSLKAENQNMAFRQMIYYENCSGTHITFLY